ncbi:MAG TPA: sulfur carrier protein ThiS [Sporichthyaceae bacterium]|jgi:sulfur carrier protein
MTTPEDGGPFAVIVNGEEREVEPGATVADVVADVAGSPDARGVAAALNGAVVPRGRWSVVQLGQDDRVEVLTAVQGG